MRARKRRCVLRKRRLPKLGIKLRELGFTTYAAYLNSPHWQELRLNWKPRKTLNGIPVCEFCLAQVRLHLHHMTYKHLGAEPEGDLVQICKSCHDSVHERFQWYGGRLSRATITIRQKNRNKRHRLSATHEYLCT